MKVCPKCNTEYDDNLEFCPEDNTELIAAGLEENVSEDVSGENVDEPSASFDSDLEAAAADVLDKDETTSDEDERAETANETDAQPSLSDSAKAQAVSSSGNGMSASTKGLLVLLVIAVLAGGLLFWKFKNPSHGAVSFNSFSREELEFLLKDANPMMLKRLKEDPELKKQQLDSLKEMLALASAAQKEGVSDDPKIKEAVKTELENIRTELIAVNYDREINKDKGPMPPFGYIGEDRIKAFWEKGDRQAAFDKFLDTKLTLAKFSKQIPEDREPSEEDIQQAKEYFAKTRIYEEEAKEKGKDLSEDYRRKLDLSIKLQQAQFLSRLYAENVLEKKTEVTDADVEKYLQEHPELNTTAEKKAKAQEVLNRAKAGEDFAALAKEFTEDPGSKEKGGLYEGVTKDSGFDKSFEGAALALQPGQIAENLVETPFGYHIIKLEKKGEQKDASGQVKESYDVRHILFSTMIKDPENPMGRDMPAKDFVKAKLQREKGKQVLDEILAKHPVTVPEDFTVPEVSEEQLKQMMEKQMPMQPNPEMKNPNNQTDEPQGKDTKKPQPAPKKDAKK